MSRLAPVQTNGFTYVITAPKNPAVLPPKWNTPAAASGMRQTVHVGTRRGEETAGNHPVAQTTTAHSTYADMPLDPEPMLLSVARNGQHNREVPRLVSKDDHLMTDAPW